MGEKQIVEIADYLAGGAIIEDIHYVRGTAYLADDLQALDEFIELPSLEDILKDREAFAKAYNLQRKWHLILNNEFFAVLLDNNLPGKWIKFFTL